MVRLLRRPLGLIIKQKILNVYAGIYFLLEQCKSEVLHLWNLFLKDGKHFYLKLYVESLH